MLSFLPLVDVYVAAIPERIEMTQLYPSKRQQEIDNVNNQNFKLQKWCTWKLLEYALECSFGIEINQVSFFKCDNGKWTADKFEFSLSHCDGAVAVAVSEKSVGVDIESYRNFSCEKLSKRILTEKENLIYEQLPNDECKDFLLKKWTLKESLFKRDGGKTFVPREYDTQENELFTNRITLNERDYMLSVATDTPDAVRVYSCVDVFNKMK